jgi:hypothetical protein
VPVGRWDNLIVAITDVNYQNGENLTWTWARRPPQCPPLLGGIFPPHKTKASEFPSSHAPTGPLAYDRPPVSTRRYSTSHTPGAVRVIWVSHLQRMLSGQHKRKSTRAVSPFCCWRPVRSPNPRNHKHLYASHQFFRSGIKWTKSWKFYLELFFRFLVCINTKYIL